MDVKRDEALRCCDLCMVYPAERVSAYSQSIDLCLRCAVQALRGFLCRTIEAQPADNRITVPVLVRYHVKTAAVATFDELMSDDSLRQYVANLWKSAPTTVAQ